MQIGEEIRPFTPKRNRPDYLYAREVKTEIRNVVLTLGAYFIMQIIISAVIEVVLMFSSGFLNDIMSNMTDMAERGALDYGDLFGASMDSSQETYTEYLGLIQIISAIASMPIFLLLRGRRLFTTDLSDRHAPLAPVSFLKLWIIAMGAQLVFNIGTGFIDRALESSGRSMTEMLEQTMEMLQNPSGLLYICLIGPIVEEIVFRGAIMRSLERFGLNFSIVISSLIFGLFHLFTVQAAFAFLMGMILGYIASRYSIRWSILAHILINSVATGVEQFGMIDGGAEGSGLFSTLSNVIFLAFFVGGVILFVRERWRIAEQKVVGAPIRIPGSPERVGAALWRAAFTSIPLLIYIVITVGIGLGMVFIPSFSIT
jgi:membrane protease YdiL (CAAX protease family)